MEIDLDTFLVTLYCVVDDLYRDQFAPLKPLRRGHKAEMSDSEVLTMDLLAQWQQNRSERAFIAYACEHWQGYFPKILDQSAFNRRTRDLSGVLCQIGPAVAAMTMPLLRPSYEVLDCVPVPLMRRCRGDRHRLFADEAAVGHGGSDDEWYYGVALMVAVNSAGLVSGFVFAPASTAQQWLAEALLRWRRDPEGPVPTAEELAGILGPSHKKGGGRVGPTGPMASWLSVGDPWEGPYLVDLGLQGPQWERHWREHHGALLLSKADYGDGPGRQGWNRWLSGLRQVVETVNGTLTEVFGLKFPRAHSLWGLLTRLAAKVTAFNLAVYINHLFARPTFAIFNPLK